MDKKSKHRIAKFLNRRMFALIGIGLAAVVIFVAWVLLDFEQRVYTREYQLQVERLKNLAGQGSEVVEERLKGYLHTLEGLSELFCDGELYTQENIEKLQKIVDENSMDFERLGIADLDGESWITNGRHINISEKQYFKDALKKEKVITEGFDSQVVEKQIFIVAVPILDSEDEVRGVLYGVVELHDFQVYRNNRLEEISQYIRVIDGEGNYIVSSKDKEDIFWEENFFEGMEKLKTEKEVAELKEKMFAGEEILLKLRGEEKEYILCITPLSTGEWYMALLLDDEFVASKVSYLLGKDIYWVIVKVGLAFALVCAVGFGYLWKEKKRISVLNSEISMSDKMIRKAVSATKAVILFYDVEEDRLKIISSKHMQLHLPAVIEKASETLSGYLPCSEETRKQLPGIMKSLRNREHSEGFSLGLEIEGRTCNYAVSLETMRDEKDRIVCYVGILEDITEKTSLEKEVRLQEGLFSSMMGFLVVDLTDDKILRSSEVFSKVYEVEGSYTTAFEKNLGRKIVPEYRAYVNSKASPLKLQEAFENNRRRFKIEYPYQNKEGKLSWMECDIRMEQSREKAHCLAYLVLQDISEKKNIEQILKEKAERDDLTGLYNRRSMVETVNKILKEPEAAESVNAFVILDLDHFKFLNDTLGHQMGDKALMEVAKVLRHHFREYDIVCRLAGDEFVIFMKNIPTEAIGRNMEALLRALNLTYTKDGRSVSISASVGIAVSPASGMDFATLYKNADKALYDAKKSGRNTYRIYEKI